MNLIGDPYPPIAFFAFTTPQTAFVSEEIAADLNRADSGSFSIDRT
jgi:hypothetical protein